MPVLRLIPGLSETSPDANDFDATASRELLEHLIAFLEADEWEVERLPQAIVDVNRFICARASKDVKAGDSAESVARSLARLLLVWNDCIEWIGSLARSARGRALYMDSLLFGDRRWEMSIRYSP